MGKREVEACVEAICHRGCQQVRLEIDQLERGRTPADTASLTVGERALVLSELKSIMSVYGDSCRIPLESFTYKKIRSGQRTRHSE